MMKIKDFQPDQKPSVFDMKKNFKTSKHNKHKSVFVLALILMVALSSLSLIVVAQAVDFSGCNLWCKIKYLFTGKIDITGGSTVITGGAVIDPAEETGLVALYHLDESSGAIIDSSGNGNHGTYNGALYSQPGKYGTALGFDGGNDYITVPTSPSLESLEGLNYSVSMWINNTGGDPYNVLLNIAGSGTGPLYILLDPNNALCRWGHFNSGFIISTDTWHHIVYTYIFITATSGTERFYVNGTLVAERTGDIVAWDNGNWYFGGRTGDHSFGGTIDEVAIYNRALNASEIAALAAEAPAEEVTCPDGAVAVWQFDETSGTTAYDAFNVNNGAINGATWIDSTTDPGIIGNSALSFDGSDDYVTIPYSTSMDFGNYNGLSLSFWMNINALKSQDRPITKYDYSIYSYFNGNSLNIALLGAPLSTGPLNLHEWYFITYTWEGSTTKMYVNGVKVDEATVSGTPASSSDDLWIGKGFGNHQWYHFNGLIDEPAIYNRALTPEEIQEHYQKGLAGESVCTAGEAPAECNDTDGDGFGAEGTDLSACSGSTTLSDCDDNNIAINPSSGCPCTTIDNCTTYCWGSTQGVYTCHTEKGNSVLPNNLVYAPEAESCANCYTGTSYLPNNACVPQWTVSQQYCYQEGKWGEVCNPSKPCIGGKYCSNADSLIAPIIS